jgi:hypothetical protein
MRRRDAQTVTLLLELSPDHTQTTPIFLKGLTQRKNTTWQVRIKPREKEGLNSKSLKIFDASVISPDI